MSKYTDIAERIVKQGIGRRWNETGSRFALGRNGPDMTVEQFCHDPRACMALMEKVIEWGGFNFIGSCTTDTFQATAYRGYGQQKKINHGVNESLPLAITLACLEALEND